MISISDLLAERASLNTARMALIERAESLEELAVEARALAEQTRIEWENSSSRIITYALQQDRRGERL